MFLSASQQFQKPPEVCIDGSQGFCLVEVVAKSDLKMSEFVEKANFN